MSTRQDFIYVLIVCYLCQVTAKVPVICSKVTYNDWTGDLLYRYDEGSIDYDCPSNNCGGQCVALAKCQCGAPRTALWTPGHNVAAHCNTIHPGTVIATFTNGIYDNGHTAVFLGCTLTGFYVMEQACGFYIRRKEYTATSGTFYNKFSVVTTDHANLNPGQQCTRRRSDCLLH